MHKRLVLVATDERAHRLRANSADALGDQRRRVAVAPHAAHHPHGLRLFQKAAYAGVRFGAPHRAQHHLDRLDGLLE